MYAGAGLSCRTAQHCSAITPAGSLDDSLWYRGQSLLRLRLSDLGHDDVSQGLLLEVTSTRGQEGSHGSLVLRAHLRGVEGMVRQGGQGQGEGSQASGLSPHCCAYCCCLPAALLLGE
jgi:hypothetical protein